MTSFLKTLKLTNNNCTYVTFKLANKLRSIARAKKTRQEHTLHVRTCGKIQIRKTIDLTQRLLAIKEES